LWKPATALLALPLENIKDHYTGDLGGRRTAPRRGNVQTYPITGDRKKMATRKDYNEIAGAKDIYDSLDFFLEVMLVARNSFSPRCQS
jgi:hypothetical protein